MKNLGKTKGTLVQSRFKVKCFIRHYQTRKTIIRIMKTISKLLRKIQWTCNH
jgi:hypothetical protein